MKADKTVFGSLEKCYAITSFYYNGEKHLVAAAEKSDPCYTYSLDGEIKDTLWTEPGGVMTVLQVPGQEILLATRKFYSPDESSEAEIIYVRNNGSGWQMKTLCRLPFVHRFGILERNHRYYLIACTLKSAHAFPGDWTCPGRVWVSPLPEDITQYDEEHEMTLYPLVSGLYKNHGFRICREKGCDYALIGSENGVFKIVPPEDAESEWITEQILNEPVSDMVYVDFDNDGQLELLTLSPFHGDTVSIYQLQADHYVKVWEAKEKYPFLHAIDQAVIRNKGYAFIGNREGERALMAVSFDFGTGSYKTDILDHGAGPANVMYFQDRANTDGYLFASNRESDEVAVYKLNAEE